MRQPEPDCSATYLVPQQTSTGVEVLVVVHDPQVPTPLTDGCGEVDRKQVDAYLAQWMISCQWTGRQDVIGAGCAELLASVTAG